MLHSLHVGVPLFGGVWVPSLPPLTQCIVLWLWGYALLPGLVVPSRPPLTPSGVFWYVGACGELVYRMFHDRGGDFCSAPSPPFGGAPWRFAPKVLSCNRDIILETECCWRISWLEVMSCNQDISFGLQYGTLLLWTCPLLGSDGLSTNPRFIVSHLHQGSRRFPCGISILQSIRHPPR